MTILFETLCFRPKQGSSDTRSWAYWHYRLGLAKRVVCRRCPDEEFRLNHGPTTLHGHLATTATTCLAPAQASGRLEFVLYGGTAIALRLGHRRSVDFDFFSTTHLDKSLLLQHMPWLIQAIVVQDERDSLTFWFQIRRTASPSKFHFLEASILAGSVSPRPDRGRSSARGVACRLMATKVKVILQRAESKDY